MTPILILFCGLLWFSSLVAIIIGISYLIITHNIEKNRRLPKWLYLYSSDKNNTQWTKYECESCFNIIKVYEGDTVPSICTKCNSKMGGISQ